MYYKIVRNNEVVDVLDRIVFVKFQEKHDLLLICKPNEAEAVLSSDGNYGWHMEGLYNFRPDNERSTMIEITKHEYNQRKNLKGYTKEEIIDAYTMELLEGGIL